MRLAVKTSLLLAVGFALILAALAAGVQYRLRSLEDGVTRQTARLLGREVAASLSEASLTRILRADAPARTHLRRLLDGLMESSEVVTSVTVVNEQGLVVASEDLPVGEQVATPLDVFGQDVRVHYKRTGRGEYTAVVPLIRAAHLTGYLNITLNSERIAGLYDDARRELLLAALIGGVVIIGIGLLVHVELTRRGRSLARAVEEALRGRTPEPSPRHDEFTEAIEAAGRFGRELSRVREDRSRMHRRLGALTESLDVGVLLLAADRELEFASPRACQMLGCPDAGALEKRWDQLRPRLAVNGGGGTAGLPLCVDLETAPDGAGRRLRLELFAVQEDGAEGYLGLVRDRGAMEALQTDLRLATRLRSFASVYLGMAHDVRSSLGAIDVHVEQLGELLDGPGAEPEVERAARRRDNLVTLRRELRRLDQSLYTLLTEAAPPSETEERFDLRVLLLDIEQVLSAQARRQKVELSVKLPDEAVLVEGARDHFKQAFLNVAVNGLEAMEDGGRMGLDLEVREGWARVRIRDTGPGIPPERLASVFEMHYTTKATGTGVGLYVARSSIEAAGGTVRVESSPGLGTCFELALPVVSEEG